jgi:hypothetical protein
MQSSETNSKYWCARTSATRAGRLAGIILLFVVALCWNNLALAQRTTGTLRGQVIDPAGAVVAECEVSAVNEATGVSLKTTTSSAGTYSFPTVLPGTYTVIVDGKGFKRTVKKGVTVLVDQDNVADARLEIGTTAETVEVVAGATAIQTTSSDLNNNFNSQDVLSLPSAAGVLNGSPLNLAILAPNVVATPGGTQGVGGSVGGTRPRDNNFTVDGVDDNNLGVTGNNSTVIPDAVSEFALTTNQFSAEYGHSAGGQFSLITKTGTNALHGSGEWYSQNRNFNSVDNLTEQAITAGTIPGMPAFDNNRFGGTVGGPIIKDKLFFFGAYEYTTLHGAGAPVALSTAPTAEGLSLLNGMAADPAVQAALADFPVAPSNNAGTLLVNGTPIPVGSLVDISPNFQREHDAQFNVDYTRGHHQFGGRFTFNQEKFILPASIPSPLWDQNEPVNNRKVALTDAWTASNNIVNDLRLQYSYYFLGLLAPCTPGVNCQPTISLNDLFSANTTGAADNQHQKQSSYQIKDTLSWVHGKHTFKFGGEYNHFIVPQFFLSRSTGNYAYSSTSDFINDAVPDVIALRGAGSGSFLGTQSLISGFAQDDIKVTPRLTLNLGLRYEFWTNPVGSNLQALNSVSNVPGVVSFGVPATDKNNFGPRVGFAYDPTGSGKTAIRGGFGVSYDVKFQNFASITLPPQLQSELNASSACTLTPTPSWCATQAGFLAGGGLPQTYIPPTGQADARNLTSSFIDPTVMPKIFTWSLGVQHELYKNATIEVRYLGTRGLELPVQFRRNDITYFDAGGTPLPTYLNPSSIPSTYSASTPTDTNFYTFVFNDEAAGFGPYGAGNTVPGLTSNTPNTYQQFGFFGFVTADPPKGSSIYHAGSVTFTQRTRSLNVNASYTYSHAIDDATNEFNTSALNPRRAQDSNNLNEDRSNSDLDVPNKFTLAISYQLPNVKSENRFAKALLNGFQLGTIFFAQSGQPITLQSGVDSNGNTDAAGDRIVFNRDGVGNTGSDVFPVCESIAGTTSGVPVGQTYIGSTPFTAAPLQGCAVNHSGPFENLGAGFDPAIGYTPVDPKAKYVVAGSGAVTNVGRNSFRTPGFSNFNLSLSKSIHFSETKSLQLRADAFNVLNHPSYALSNGSVFNAAGIAAALANGGYAQPANAAFLNATNFGGGIRQMTLGLKFLF